MKKIINSSIGIWCGLICFVSPIWLTVIYLNITGMIYKYDYSMDEGTALIIGLFLFILWVLIGVIPNILWGRNANSGPSDHAFRYELIRLSGCN